MAIDGTYNIEIELPAGKETGKGILKTDGNALSGALVDKDGTESPFDGGTIDGDAFSFRVAVDTLTGVMKGTGFALKFTGSRA